MLEQFFLAGGPPGRELDERHRNFGQSPIGPADHGGGADRGVLEQAGLDLRGGDVLAAHLEHVFGAAEVGQTGRRRPPEVTGVEPAGLVEPVPAGVEVAGHELAPA